MKSMMFRGILLGLALLVLSACGTVRGPFNGLGSDPMSMLIIYRTDNSPLTYSEYLAVQGVAAHDHLVLMGQLSSPFEAMVTDGFAGAVAGAAGGATQGLFYTGGMAGPAAGYSAAVYGLGYLVNGALSYSYGTVYDMAQMVETTMRDDEKYDHNRIFYRLHVVAAFVASSNKKNEPASYLKKRMPDFTGRRANYIDQIQTQHLIPMDDSVLQSGRLSAPPFRSRMPDSTTSSSTGHY